MKYLLFLGFSLSAMFLLLAQDIPASYDTLPRNHEIVLKGNIGYAASNIEKAILSTFYRGGFIDSDTKDASLNKHKAINRVGLDASAEFTYINYKNRILKNKPWGFLVKGGYFNFGGAVYAKDLFALGFYGNANYVGDTMEMSGSSAGFTAFQKVGFGLIDSKTKSSISFNVYNISQRFNAGFRTLELAQNDAGDEVSLAMDGEVYTSNSNKFNQGIGFGLDVDYKLQFEWKEGKTAFVQFLAQNIGFAYLNEKQKLYQVDTTFNYTGFTFSDLIGENAIIQDSINILDTLGVDSRLENRTILLPGFLQVSKIVDGMSSSKLQSFFGVRLYPSLIYSPYIFAGLNYRPITPLNIGLSASYGGFAKFQAGMYATYQISKLSVGLGSENIIGFFTPKANGESLKIRLSCVF